MFRQLIMVSTLAATFFTTAVLAQAPAAAPAGSTGLCRDGSYWTGAVKKGACRGHKGVQDWYASTDTAATGGGTAPAAAAPAAAATAPAPTAASAPTPAPAAATPAVPVRKTSTMPTVAAAGGGPGLVWVNTSSKVYHCPSDRWYGKTKSGEYMSEADALAKGNRADHGKACK